jgi:hypothetical protein
VDNAPAVGEEGDREHGPGMALVALPGFFQHPQQLAGPDLPHLRGAVNLTRDDPAAVRREVDRGSTSLVAGEAVEPLPRDDIPQNQRRVGSHNDLATIGGEGDSLDETRRPRESQPILAGDSVPDDRPPRAVNAAGGHAPAIR